MYAVIYDTGDILCAKITLTNC